MSLGINNILGLGSNWQVVKVGGAQEFSAEQEEEAVSLMKGFMKWHEINPEHFTISTSKGHLIVEPNESVTWREVIRARSLLSNWLKTPWLYPYSRSEDPGDVFKIPLGRAREELKGIY